MWRDLFLQLVAIDLLIPILQYANAHLSNILRYWIKTFWHFWFRSYFGIMDIFNVMSKWSTLSDILHIAEFNSKNRPTLRSVMKRGRFKGVPPVYDPLFCRNMGMPSYCCRNRASDYVWAPGAAAFLLKKVFGLSHRKFQDPPLWNTNTQDQIAIIHIVAEMIKHCISNFGENYLFSHFLSLVSQYWQNFACQFAKMSFLQNLVTYMTCNLALTAMKILMLSWTFYFFWDTRFYHLSNDMLNLGLEFSFSWIILFGWDFCNK